MRRRMIVSPGREASGIMHMPTGQSGHPLSPYYANSHDAWVAGKATPFLAGADRAHAHADAVTQTQRQT
jgi:penicillin amidase